jgi:hypothetical protein
VLEFIKQDVKSTMNINESVAQLLIHFAPELMQ